MPGRGRHRHRTRGAAAAGPAASRSERAGGAGGRGQGQHLRHGRRRRVRSAGAPGPRQPVGRRRGRRTGAGGRSTTTDETGRFAFSALPEGRFNLSASKPGHVSGTYGQRQPGRPGTPIQLADGQRLQVQLQITRGGVITGTVLDENAEAIPGTPVRALRYVMQSGQRTLQSAGNGQTDDRGVYRIYGLQPGEYIVFATPRNNNLGIDAGRQVELQQLVQQSAAMERLEAVQAQAQALQERIAQLRSTLQASTTDEASTGYAPVYYPGTTTPSSAATVTVGPGEEKGSVDFQYQVVPIARVDGIVTSPSAQLPVERPGDARQHGVRRAGNLSWERSRRCAGRVPDFQRAPRPVHTRRARDDRRRRPRGWPGRAGGPGGRGPMPWRARRASRGAWPRRSSPAADPIRLWATADVTVDGRNVSNVVLTLQPGMSVSGRIVFEGTTLPPPADLTRLRVTLAPVVTPGTSGDVATRVGRSRRRGGALHDRERRAGPLPAERVRRGHGLVSRIVGGRRSGLARLPGRGQTQPEHHRRRRHVRRSAVRAHRHDRQRTGAARSRLHA